MNIMCTRQTINIYIYIYIYAAILYENVYVTGFAKRDNSVFKLHISVKVSPSITLCWYSLLTTFQVISLFQSEVMDCQRW